MPLCRVYFKLRFTNSARTMNLDHPTEGAAKETLVKQCIISKDDARDVVIQKIEIV